jgi:TatD family-associated radical SAM protein
MTIFYKLYDKLYVNITNKCSCSCIFCLRQSGESVGGADSLWLEREPSLDEIKAAFDQSDLKGMTEIVFCGYGEPMERAADVIELCGYIKSKCDLPVRINTNGLVKLIEPDFDMRGLSAADSISISLNADDGEEYLRVTRSRFGPGSYAAMLSFAREAKEFTNVCFTIVDTLEPARIEKCREIAAETGVPLRIRAMVTNNADFA